jgi:hypothetical protein
MITGSDKYYIGRRKCKIKDPMTDGYFGSGNWVRKIKDKSRLFKVVLAVFDNIEDCKAEEQRLLDIHVGLPDNMNISTFSHGGSIAGENHPGRGKHRSEESKAKMSAAKSGKKHTEETRAKQSVAKSRENNPMHGHIHTKEAREKMSAANSGENHPGAKVTEADVKLIRELYATGDYTQKELALKFNVKVPAISNIVNRKTWNPVK